MNEVVERVARAMCAGFGDEWGARNCALMPEDYRDMARAAIAAMEQPTEAMQIAGHNVRNDPATGMPTHCGTDEIYTAMIDAALKD